MYRFASTAIRYSYYSQFVIIMDYSWHRLPWLRSTHPIQNVLTLDLFDSDNTRTSLRNFFPAYSLCHPRCPTDVTTRILWTWITFVRFELSRDLLYAVQSSLQFAKMKTVRSTVPFDGSSCTVTIFMITSFELLVLVLFLHFKFSIDFSWYDLNTCHCRANRRIILTTDYLSHTYASFTSDKKRFDRYVLELSRNQDTLRCLIIFIIHSQRDADWDLWVWCDKIRDRPLQRSIARAWQWSRVWPKSLSICSWSRTSPRITQTRNISSLSTSSMRKSCSLTHIVKMNNVSFVSFFSIMMSDRSNQTRKSSETWQCIW